MRTALSLLLVAFAQLGAVVKAHEQSTLVPPPNLVSRLIYITHVNVIDTETGKEV